MNNKPSPDLFNDLIEDALPPGFSEATLARTLAFAKRRRRQRTLVRTAVVAMPLVALACVLATRREDRTPGASQVVARAPAIPASVPASSPVHELSDRELIALFPGRKMALVGSGNDKVLIFVDGKGAQS